MSRISKMKNKAAATMMTWRTRPQNLEITMNKSALIMAQIAENGIHPFLTRVTSNNVAGTMSCVLKVIPEAGGVPPNQSRPALDQGKRQAKKKRGSELNDIYFDVWILCEKVRSKGFEQALHCFAKLQEKIETTKAEVADPNETTFKVADDIAEYMSKLSLNDEATTLGGVCCFLHRACKPRGVPCQMAVCSFMIEVGDRCWEIPSDVPHERVMICIHCYGANKGSVRIRSRIRSPVEARPFEWGTVTKRKDEFVKTYLDPNDMTPEPTKTCAFCHNEHHVMCTLYDEFNWAMGYGYFCEQFSGNKRPGYVCRRCINEMNPAARIQLRDIIVFHPKDIQETELSRHIEAFLIQHLNDPALSRTLIVREVSTQNFTFEAKPRMKKVFKQNNMDFIWIYKRRNIILFQETTGSNYPVSVFNLIANEYESKKTVTLAYIDSVKLVQPDSQRRSVFQHTVLGYMDYVRRFGYENLNIWICPPKPGDEYVFYGRPAEDQKYVTGINTGIINWYEKLLIEGVGKDIVSDYTHDPPKTQHYFELPYLADDFLVDKMEEIIDLVEREEVEFSNRTSTTKRASRSKAASKQHNLTPPTIQGKVDELLATSDITDQLYYVKLEVPDQIVKEQGKDIMCAYMSNRDNFIVDCRENKFDYSDLRRAQFTTMKLCSRMAQECFARKCEGCKKIVFKGFYCYLCPSNPVYCKKCKAEHLQHSDVGLRKFVSPFGPKKLHPSPAFKVAMSQLHGEGQFLNNIGFWLPRLDEHHEDNTEIGGREDAVVVKRHLDLLNKNSDHHDVTNCLACLISYAPLIRHQEFCRGKVCEVPSCMSTPVPFTNNGDVIYSA